MKKILLLALGLAIVGTAIGVVLASRRKSRAVECASRLRRLWALQVTDVVGNKSRWSFPKLTGADFWLRLTRTSPPLIDASLESLLQCPTRAPSAGRRLDFRGPARPVSELSASDVVGACIADHGGGDITVLLKSGDVLSAIPGDPLYDKALTSTR